MHFKREGDKDRYPRIWKIINVKEEEDKEWV